MPVEEFRKLIQAPPKKKKGKEDFGAWDAFSLMIRLRDVGSDGTGKCFTCPRIIKWNKGDCGHGIPRQEKPTKYHEQNNHLQCKSCNGFHGGMREVYKAEMDKRYGAGTWDKLMLMSKGVVKRSRFEFEAMKAHYEQEAERIRKQKGL